MRITNFVFQRINEVLKYNVTNLIEGTHYNVHVSNIIYNNHIYNNHQFFRQIACMFEIQYSSIVV